MQRLILVFIILCLSGFAAVPVCRADEVWTGNVNVTLGGKSLDDDDWGPVDDQGELGLSVDFRQPSWPVNIYIGFSGSGDDDDTYLANGRYVDVEGSTSELKLGVRKIWEPSATLRPFIGGGLDLVAAEFEGSSRGIWVDDEDSALGLWLSGGVYWTVSTNFNVGLEVGISKATVDLFGEDIEAGGGHAALLLGYHW